jgi:two-component system chemotaxis sensor kinase CheA
MDIDIASYKNLYVQTAKDNLAGMVASITSLEANPADTRAIENIFIKSHSLKGQSMTMGYTGIAKVSLAIERYMRGLKDGNKQVDPSVLPVLRMATGKLQASLAQIEEKNAEIPVSEIITTLEQRLGVKI